MTVSETLFLTWTIPINGVTQVIMALPVTLTWDQPNARDKLTIKTISIHVADCPQNFR